MAKMKGNFTDEMFDLAMSMSKEKLAASWISEMIDNGLLKQKIKRLKKDYKNLERNADAECGCLEERVKELQKEMDELGIVCICQDSYIL